MLRPYLLPASASHGSICYALLSFVVRIVFYRHLLGVNPTIVQSVTEVSCVKHATWHSSRAYED